MKIVQNVRVAKNVRRPIVAMMRENTCGFSKSRCSFEQNTPSKLFVSTTTTRCYYHFQFCHNQILSPVQVMCGILAILNEHIRNHQRFNELLTLINQRGPDSQPDAVQITTNHGSILQFKSSVLHLRGVELHQQPSVDELTGSILLFNGQIYRYGGEPLDSSISDTRFLELKLRTCKSKQELADVFAPIDGPFAFVYWSKVLDCLFYGRDIFGRKSLCILSDDKNKPILISSVAPPYLARDGLTWTEIDCTTINCIEFGQYDQVVYTKFHWNIDDIFHKTQKCQPRHDESTEKLHMLNLPYLRPLNLDLTKSDDFDETERRNALDGLEKRFLNAVDIRIKDNKFICLECRKESNKKVCQDTKVAVAFSGGIDSTLLALALNRVMNPGETIDLVTVAFKDRSPDRQSVGSAFIELRNLCPDRKWRLVLCDITVIDLQAARQTQISSLIWPCNTVIDDSLGCACWFIGRARGRALDSEMKTEWIQSNLEEYLKFQPTYQDNTGSCHLRSDYHCPASMIFVGSSIDEQLGGYGSHKTAWRDLGPQGALDEISFLMRRLSTRNLGRDDRVYSSHGRDVKLPYLDYDLVSYLNSLPVCLKMNLDEPPEVGPKKILRELAHHWGLSEAGKRVKRALQFGTRIANLENPGEKGDQPCSRLLGPELVVPN